MKYLDEYRDGAHAQAYARALRGLMTRPWTLMEVCGGQTHAIVRYGIDALLPEGLTLVHGPGCPVCVTPPGLLDQAAALSLRPGVTLCSFGDMLRVPGSDGDLFTARARGGDVRVVYSPLDALRLAQRHPERQVVFFAVGFETTAPATALAVAQARQAGVTNFTLLMAHVLVPPAMRAILSSPERRVQGFLAAGHVCAVMGYTEYEPLSLAHRVPIVVTGFQPLDILQGIYQCVRQLEEGRAEVENQYTRSVGREGNPGAQALVRDVFQVVDRRWRGLGEIPESGLGLSEAYADFDAERRFGLRAGEGPAGADPQAERETECQAGKVLLGVIRPPQCPAFGGRCTPERPLGAPMVSSEGACAAYYQHRRCRSEGEA
jgi:hydrogenase expression/formation protein HypD